MGISAFSSGWQDYDSYDDDDDGGSGGGLTKNEKLYRFRFSIPSPDGTPKRPNLVVPGRPATKRIMFLDGSPFHVYEHGTYGFDNAYKILGAFNCICPVKNGLTDETCPVCGTGKKTGWAYYAGFLPVVDMGQVEYRGGRVVLHHETWENNKGDVFERSFQTVLYCAKRGSEDKPGTLRLLKYELDLLREKYGIENLTGTVWDMTRTGEKCATVGDKFEFIERVDPKSWVDYLVKCGADEDKLDLEVPVYHDENRLDGVFDIPDMDEYLSKLKRLVGIKASGDSRSQARVSGASFGNGYSSAGPRDNVPHPSDDDIPF